jgi:hypothetical protein
MEHLFKHRHHRIAFSAGSPEDIVGGNWLGPPDETNTFLQTMRVDYVRVFHAPNTSERFEASFTDDLKGWRQISIPFADFSQSMVQSEGAPDDGLDLTAIWGFGFRPPAAPSIWIRYGIGKWRIAVKRRSQKVMAVNLRKARRKEAARKARRKEAAEATSIKTAWFG